MSAIRFHFAEGPVLHVRGPERAAMEIQITGTAAATARLTGYMGNRWYDGQAVDLFGPFVGVTDPADSRRNGLAQMILMSLSSHGSRAKVFSWKGQEIDAWSLALNTALAVGSDPIRLSAKINATCEIHGYFEGQDREWLAGIIEEGLEAGIFRKELRYEASQIDPRDKVVSMGWTELIEQLRAPHEDDDAVVMSFTVTDGFPDPPKTWRPNLEGEERYEAWYELPDRTRFDLALAEVRELSGNKPISPETLRKWRFQHELSLLDLMTRDFDKIERNLGLRE